MNLRLGRTLEGSLAGRAAGRVMLIDAYRSWACGTWVGDITARWADAPPKAGFVPARPIEGVPVFVARRLPGLLAASGASVHEGGRFRRKGLRVELDRPELWIDWLNRPDAFGVPAPDPDATL